MPKRNARVKRAFTPVFDGLCPRTTRNAQSALGSRRIVNSMAPSGNSRQLSISVM
jgi:hypothetical protein